MITIGNEETVEVRVARLEEKIDTMRGEIQSVLTTVASLADDMRRTTSSIRSEHAADRELFRMVLKNARRGC